MYFLVCKGRSNDGVGMARGTVFQALRPGAGFKTGDFVEEKFGRLSQNGPILVVYLGHGVFSSRHSSPDKFLGEVS